MTVTDCPRPRGPSAFGEFETSKAAALQTLQSLKSERDKKTEKLRAARLAAREESAVSGCAGR